MEEAEDKREFDRGEMGELLKLFSSLGVTVAFGITALFFIGLRADRGLVSFGLDTHGLGKFVGLFLGLGLTGYWAYQRILRHLRKFEKPRDVEE